MLNSIDVIVHGHRNGPYLRACVRSVLAQHGVKLRVLVIDDASPDDCGAIAEQLRREDPRVEVQRHAHHLGPIASCNEGLAWAVAAHVMVLSADELLLPGALARATALMARDSEIAFCFGEAHELWPDGPLRAAPSGLAHPGAGPHRARVIEGYDFIDLCARRACVDFVPPPSVVLRTALVRRVGGYRPELSRSAGLELRLRLAAHGSVGYLPEVQAICRRQPASALPAFDGLADLLQRQAAVESFCRDCARLWPWMSALRQRLLQPIGREAVRHANAAFDAGDQERTSRLLGLASTLHPGIKGDPRWIVLACKRRVGKKAWRALAPALHRLRGMVSRLAI